LDPGGAAPDGRGTSVHQPAYTHHVDGDATPGRPCLLSGTKETHRRIYWRPSSPGISRLKDIIGERGKERRRQTTAPM